MTPILAVAMASRGKDSWGVTDGHSIYKDATNIVDGFQDYGLEGPSYHTRGASVGSVCEQNAHPFLAEHNGLRVIGMHNGHISNHWDLNRKYPERQCQVDSEHIFRHLAERKPLAEIGGWGTIVWYEGPVDGSAPMKRYFSSWAQPNLHVAKLEDGTFVYASTLSSIERALRFADIGMLHEYQIKPLVKYSFGEHDLLEHETLDWATAPYKQIYTPTQGAGYGVVRGHHSGGRASGDAFAQAHCRITSCSGLLKKAGDYLCQLCLYKLRDGLGLVAHGHPKALPPAEGLSTNLVADAQADAANRAAMAAGHYSCEIDEVD